MKKIIIKYFLIFICCLTAIFLSSCDLSDKILRNKMLEYYSNDDIYVELTGEIRSIEKSVYEDEAYVIIFILTYNDDEFSYLENTECSFHVLDESEYLDKIKEGDIITFITASKHFYNGHVLPIFSVEKGECEILSFNTGKSNYEEWIHYGPIVGDNSNSETWRQ